MSTRSARGRTTLRLVAPVTGLALLLAACTTTGGGASSPAASAAPAASQAPAASGTPLEGTDWLLTDYAGPEGTTIPVPEAVAATALFEGGKVSGNSGCNTYNGSYTLDGDKITISQLATTMMACGDVQMALEAAFTTAMGKVATWSITGDTLELKTAEGKVGLRFAATESPALTGTRWVATGINNGRGGVESVATGTEVTAIFGDDGQVTGSGGCNTYNGPYTVDGSKIKIGPVASTKMACEGSAGTQEAAYFMALEKATTFDFVQGRLELRDDGGALQVSYQATQP
jgi:heat shock protein HslJ